MSFGGLPSNHQEYSPLLDVGMHPMSVQQLRELCVDGLPTSESRNSIMEAFEGFVQKLCDAGIDGELWIDGSFLTEKIAPNDIDFVLRIRAEIDENADEAQREAIDSLHESDPLCHGFVLIEYGDDDDRYWHWEWMRAYWMKQWGFSRDATMMKGIAVISLLGKTTT